MRRREFIAGVGSVVAAWPVVVRAQYSGGKLPRVGIIDNVPIWEYFRKRLSEQGYIDGRSIAYEYRVANGDPERLKRAANELAKLPVDVIATFGTPAARAAQAATTTIPIVAISVGDPIRAGLVSSLARPSGNITGNTILGPDLSPKRLEIVKEIIPSVSTVALLWNPDNASNAAIYDELRGAVTALGIKLVSLEARSSKDFDAVFANTLMVHPDVMLTTNDPLHQQNIQRVIDFMLINKLPGVFQTRENVVAGGLLSYGASFPELFRNGANYTQKILQGTKPTDLPILQPERFELVINLKTANALGLKISEAFLLRADEVIE